MRNLTHTHVAFFLLWWLLLLLLLSLLTLVRTTFIIHLHYLCIAAQAAMGVAAIHNVDKEGQASIAHTDIAPGQFIRINGMYKLNDFNRARFIQWSPYQNLTCGYYVGKNPGKNRSPEEYQYMKQTEKVREGYWCRFVACVCVCVCVCLGKWSHTCTGTAGRCVFSWKYILHVAARGMAI